MKKFLLILTVAVSFIGCHQEYDVPIPQKEREVLPAPTRIERYPSLLLNDSLMVLGEQLENPYALDVMQEARVQLLAENPGMSIPAITSPSHYYVRFAPANDDELYTLLQDTTVHFFDFPLDREVISGVYYHDPAIADSLPTYQYASIPVEQWVRDYAESNISREILEYLFIPEDEEEFFGGGGDDDGDGNWWDNGNITPIIPENPWIPALPGDEEINPNTITLSPENIIDMLVDKALYLTGNLDSDSDTSTQSVAGTNSSSSAWTPSGRITAYDDIAGGQIPLEGVKVHARRWFTTYTGITNADGYFTCDGTFKKPANYCIKWERAYLDIREGYVGQAYYNGPKQSTEWNLDITSDSEKSLRYATIHRAAYRIYYGNINGLMRPGHTRKEKISYFHRECWTNNINGSYYSYQLGAGIVSDVRIFGKNSNGWSPMSQIFSTTCHELGHVIHCVYTPSRYHNAETRYLEAWARCFQYYITQLEYQDLGVLHNLNIVSEGKNNITPDHDYNFQLWNKAYHNHDYPVIFVDVIDNYNQSNSLINPEHPYPNDNVHYNGIKSLESIVLNSTTFDEVREKLILKSNSLTHGLNANDINTLFDYYEY